jgi:hypothetical protein
MTTAAWPHERGFRFRPLLFALLSLLAVARARSTSGVSNRSLILGLLVTGVVCAVVYFYVLALGRLDARFRHFHPRKFRVTNVAVFYLFGGLAAALLIAGPWLVTHDRNETTAEWMAYYFAVPCCLSAAAAVYRVLDRHRTS